MPYELSDETQAAAKRFHEMREKLGYTACERAWNWHLYSTLNVGIKGQTVADLQAKERREQEAKGA